MLILDAKISFYKPNDNIGLSNDLNTKYIIRPTLNFGNNILLSGTIKANKNVEKLIRGNYYTVTIEMPTVEREAYEQIKSLVFIGNIFKIQEASRVIGEGEILDYILIN